MLPFDNKSELQVIIDMPEGTTLEETARVGPGDRRVSEDACRRSRTSRLYVGTCGAHQLQRPGAPLLPAQRRATWPTSRSTSSPRASARRRATTSPSASGRRLKAIGDRYGARVKVAEIPPGPPVLEHAGGRGLRPGPRPGRSRSPARSATSSSRRRSVVDVDWYVEDDQKKIIFEVDQEKGRARTASRRRRSPRAMRIALSGAVAGLVHLEKEREPVEIVLRMPLEQRADRPRAARGGRTSPRGRVPVPLAELVRVQRGRRGEDDLPQEPQAGGLRDRRCGGHRGEPGLRHPEDEGRRSKNLKLPEGYELKQYSAVQPWLEDRYAMKWDGEWHITYEVFRDLGIAFAAVLVSSTSWWWPGSELRDAARHHGAHPADPGRHPARPLDLRGLLHGHLHDRLHRPGRASSCATPSCSSTSPSWSGGRART